MATELLSAAELARRLGVKPMTVRHWVLKGRIPEIRFSRKVRRFDLDAVIQALQAQEDGKGVKR
jgi:excisionase family DNA binding protein